MAKKPTASAPTAFVLEGSFLAALTAIAAAGVMNVSSGDTVVLTLADNGLIELNHAARDGDNVPARATEAGNKALADLNTGNADDSDDTSAYNGFEIEESEQYVAPKESVKRGPRLTPKEEKYPFSKLPAPRVGEDGKLITAKFFVADPEGKTDKDGSPLTALKSLGSTVSAASRRFATETGEYKKQKRKVTETVQAKNEDGTPKFNEKGEAVQIEQTVTKEVDVPVLNYERKFRIYAGEKNGVKGAFIEREK